MHRFVPLLIALAVVVISSFAEEKTKDADLLIKDLKDSNPLVQHSAALALGEIKDDRAIEPLIQALKDNETNVRAVAAFALSRIGKPSIDPLLLALMDNDSDIRAGASLAIGMINDTRAIEQSKLIGAGTNKGESLLRIASGSNGIIPSGIAALQDPAGL